MDQVFVVVAIVMPLDNRKSIILAQQKNVWRQLSKHLAKGKRASRHSLLLEITSYFPVEHPGAAALRHSGSQNLLRFDTCASPDKSRS